MTTVASEARADFEYVNVASVVSAIAVVFLHTNAVFWHFDRDAFYWASANVIESVCYFAVPIFFMISGATLLDFNKRYGLRTYFFRRLSRAGVPFLFWSFLGLAFQIIILKWISFDVVTPKYLLEGLLTGRLVEIYWFFIPLFCIYLAIPLFAAVPEEKRKVLFTYLSAAGLLFNVIPPFVLSATGKQLANELSIGVVAGYLFFIPVGYLISRYEISFRQRLTIYLLGACGLAAHLFGTYFYSIRDGKISDVFKGYTNLPCVLYSIAVFVFIKYATPRVMSWKLIARLINLLRGYTLSIYLLHIYVICAVMKKFDGIQYSLTYRLLAPFGIVAVVTLAAWVIRKFPGGKRVLP